MVGHGYASHAVVDSLVDQLGDTCLTIKDAVLCVYV
jgi:hypothetical protein